MHACNEFTFTFTCHYIAFEIYCKYVQYAVSTVQYASAYLCACVKRVLSLMKINHGFYYKLNQETMVTTVKPWQH